MDKFLPDRQSVLADSEQPAISIVSPEDGDDANVRVAGKFDEVNLGISLEAVDMH